MPAHTERIAAAPAVVADFGVLATGHEPPIAVVACLLAQIAVVADSTGDAVIVDAQRQPDRFGAPDPRGFVVDLAGEVHVPTGYSASGPDLLELFAELIGDQPVPAQIARLLLAKSPTDARELAAVLRPVGDQTQVAELLSQGDDTTGSGSVGSSTLPGRGTRSHSPAAARARKVDPLPSRPKSAGSSRRDQSSKATTRQKVVGLVGVVAATAFAAVVLMSGTPGPENVSATGDADESATNDSGAVAAAGQPTVAPQGTETRTAAITYPTSWTALLATLDSSRAAAFAAGDDELLGDVNIAGSPAAKADKRKLTELNQIGVLAQGLSSKIESVDVVSARESEVLLAISDVLGAYKIVAEADGAVIESRKPRSQQSWEVTLRPIDGQWRIYETVRR